MDGLIILMRGNSNWGVRCSSTLFLKAMFHKIASVLYVNYCYNVLKDSLEVQIEIHPFKNQVDAELLISAV